MKANAIEGLSLTPYSLRDGSYVIPVLHHFRDGQTGRAATTPLDAIRKWFGKVTALFSTNFARKVSYGVIYRITELWHLVELNGTDL